GSARWGHRRSDVSSWSIHSREGSDRPPLCLSPRTRCSEEETDRCKRCATATFSSRNYFSPKSSTPRPWHDSRQGGRGSPNSCETPARRGKGDLERLARFWLSQSHPRELFGKRPTKRSPKEEE